MKQQPHSFHLWKTGAGHELFYSVKEILTNLPAYLVDVGQRLYLQIPQCSPDHPSISMSLRSGVCLAQQESEPAFSRSPIFIKGRHLEKARGTKKDSSRKAWALGHFCGRQCVLVATYFTSNFLSHLPALLQMQRVTAFMDYSTSHYHAIRMNSLNRSISICYMRLYMAHDIYLYISLYIITYYIYTCMCMCICMCMHTYVYLL